MTIKLILLTTLCAATQFAQNWNKVQELKPGQDVRVETASAKQSGALIEVQPDAIRFRSAEGAEARVAREQIARVYVKKKSHRLRNALIGTGIGVAVGTVLYGTLGTLFRNEGQESPELLAVPIMVGAAAGGLLPSGGMKLVYDARKKK